MAQNKKTEIRCVKFKTKANLHPPSHRTAPPNWLEAVRQGQALAVMEAMKMEHVHAAPIAGRVAALHVSLGEQVASHRVVAEVVAEPVDGAAKAG
jgi:hypothetical protein